MLEFILHFEQMAMRFSPVVLIGAGSACVLVGLYLWLGGLGFRRTLAVVVGIVSGGTCGFFVSGRNVVPAIVSAIVAAVITIKFEKVFMIILTAVLATALSFVVTAGPYIEQAGALKNYPQYKAISAAEPLDLGRTIETVKIYLADFSAGLRQVCSELPITGWAIIAMVAVVSIAAALLFWRFTAGLCCATLGTMLVFAGMILLLLFKGSLPISYICRRSTFYLGVFAAMIVFGTIVQLMLCRAFKPKPTAQTEADADKAKGSQESTRRHLNWRTH